MARNERLFGVEADLVAEDADALVLVEVKTSRSRASVPLGAVGHRPLDRVGPQRLQRLAVAARALARASGRAAARVDAIEVWIASPRRRVELAWHRDLGPRPGRRSERARPLGRARPADARP